MTNQKIVISFPFEVSQIGPGEVELTSRDGGTIVLPELEPVNAVDFAEKFRLGDDELERAYMAARTAYHSELLRGLMRVEVREVREPAGVKKAY